MVNEAFVRHFLPGPNPLGRRFKRGLSNVRRALDIEVVGVVKDAKYSSMREAPPRVFYTPYRQGPQPTGLQFLVRSASALSVLAVVAMAAAYLPARRATRIDPMVALRHEQVRGRTGRDAGSRSRRRSPPRCRR